MATPVRMIIPGSSYLCQRRTSERRFFLKPSHNTNAVIQYVLGWAANKHGILLHEYLFEFNHYHEVMSDPFGNMPAFKRDFHAMLSRALGHQYKRAWPIWDHQSYNACRLETESAELDSIIYTLTNPMQDNLVKRLSDWKGVHSFNLNYGESITIQKPKGFFSDEMPEFVSLTLTRPTHLMTHLSDMELRDLIRRNVTIEENRLQQERQKQGLRVFGMLRLLKQDITNSPLSERKLFKLQPSIKAKNRWVMLEAIQRKRQFKDAYHAAFKRLRERADKIVFPPGTYGLVSLGIVQA
jgi:putative transposase